MRSGRVEASEAALNWASSSSGLPATAFSGAETVVPSKHLLELSLTGEGAHRTVEIVPNQLSSVCHAHMPDGNIAAVTLIWDVPPIILFDPFELARPQASRQVEARVFGKYDLEACASAATHPILSAWHQVDNS